jgi:hypothetical protein
MGEGGSSTAVVSNLPQDLPTQPVKIAITPNQPRPTQIQGLLADQLMKEFQLPASEEPSVDKFNLTTGGKNLTLDEKQQRAEERKIRRQAMYDEQIEPLCKKLNKKSIIKRSKVHEWSDGKIQEYIDQLKLEAEQTQAIETAVRQVRTERAVTEAIRSEIEEGDESEVIELCDESELAAQYTEYQQRKIEKTAKLIVATEYSVLGPTAHIVNHVSDGYVDFRGIDEAIKENKLDLIDAWKDVLNEYTDNEIVQTLTSPWVGLAVAHTSLINSTMEKNAKKKETKA